MSIASKVTHSTILDNPQHTTGSRDYSPHGVDLPLADLVAQAPVETPQRFRNWPDLQARLQWAHDACMALELPRLEREVLKHVCWRAGRRKDGQPPGCFESTGNIGAALGVSRKYVGQALAGLVAKGLLEVTRRFQNTTIYRPALSLCVVTTHRDVSLRPTNKKNNKKGAGSQISNSLNLLDYRAGDSDESCGYSGCPGISQPCPMCGRQRGTVKNGC